MSNTPTREDAKKKFPKGTVFSNKNIVLRSTGKNVTVTGDHFYWDGQEIVIHHDSVDSFSNWTIFKAGEWAEILNKKEDITPENSILDEAKRRYPPGTKYRCARGDRTATDTIKHGDVLKWYGKTSFEEIDALGRDFVYSKGRWAEILEEPENPKVTEAKNKYPVGTTFIPAHCKETSTTRAEVLATDEFIFTSGEIYLKDSTSKQVHASKRAGGLNLKIYCTNKGWATIVKSSKSELPEKWALAVNEESYKVFKHHRSVSEPLFGFITSDAYSGRDWGYWIPKNAKGYTEISLETFVKYVLKEAPPPIPRSDLGALPSWVESGVPINSAGIWLQDDGRVVRPDCGVIEDSNLEEEPVKINLRVKNKKKTLRNFN